MAAALHDIDLLLYLVFADRKLVSAIWAHDLLVLRRSARETLLGRWRGLVFRRGRPVGRDTEAEVEAHDVIVHPHSRHVTRPGRRRAGITEELVDLRLERLPGLARGVCAAPGGLLVFYACGTVIAEIGVLPEPAVAWDAAACAAHALDQPAYAAPYWLVACADAAACHSGAVAVDARESAGVRVNDFVFVVVGCKVYCCVVVAGICIVSHGGCGTAGSIGRRCTAGMMSREWSRSDYFHVVKLSSR